MPTVVGKFLAVALVLLAGGPALADVLVFAAASTSGPVQEITARFSAAGFGRARASFAASSALARQITRGAPADVFISAHPRWMDYLEREKAIEPASRFVLLGNRLALVAPAGSSLEYEPGKPPDIGESRLAMGDPDHVPVGIYGAEALKKMGFWEAMAPRLARASHAPAAVALVARGEVAAGIVYRSDAALLSGVRVVLLLPENSHTPIAYPAAVCAGRDRAEVRRFVEFLTSPESAAVFNRFGFSVVGKQ